MVFDAVVLRKSVAFRGHERRHPVKVEGRDGLPPVHSPS